MTHKLLTLLSLISIGTLPCHAGTENTFSACDVACHLQYQKALASEVDSWVNFDVAADKFYDSPANVSAYAAGDLVKWDDLTPEQISQIWSLPSGVSLSRIFYMSEDISGNAIPATGFVLIPYSNPLGEGQALRTVVWAHGTAGGTRQCAPSNHKALYYGWEGPFALVQQGYIVIAPDYAGQGSDIPQGFMYESGALHAGDVGFAVQAVRSRLGNLLTHEWVVVGHSEGGMTAWRTNEREARPGKATGGFLGAVSAAPALRPLSLIPESFRLANGGPVGDVVSIFFLQSVSRLFPSVRVEDYVSDIVLDRIPLADHGCLATGVALYSDLTQTELYKDISWLELPELLDWQERFNGAGPHKLAGPMLVVQGLADMLTYANATEEDFDLTCEAFPNSTAELLLYPDLDHDPVSYAAQADYLGWIADRFNNVPLEKGCQKRTIARVVSSASF